jgi:TfoX/Sxy family transcriptional regulator of competence genes
MAYDEALADGVRDVLADRPDVTAKRMFGGLAFLVRGNMAVAVRGQGGLLVRVDPAEHDDLLAEPGTETMTMRGRPIRGWLSVAPAACASHADLAAWVKRGLTYALALPAR